MGLSGWHLLILALVALLVFGGSGRISSIMGDMAKGIKSFKKGLTEDDEDERPEARAPDPRIIDQRPVKSAERDTTKTG
ncbi:twin-arginine translocase TatA/TatE family subunit [Hyphomicrobium sp. xq]|uniref:Sec-independent protein translocase protein TatA n=1 Tax=Hyphomicrobium album TaxID=2665159 RepID=A0A6I3KQ53_9HYPH|nr:twin-arginine translocase TatA/TatE family subunit [Hyphomicrobium album]MTD96080.1 twin-arginine translocase TatA/TatE family subunit [Hyphomicrobium album]